MAKFRLDFAQLYAVICSLLMDFANSLIKLNEEGTLGLLSLQIFCVGNYLVNMMGTVMILKCSIFLKIKRHQNEDTEQIPKTNYSTLHCREQMLNVGCGVEPSRVPHHASFIHPNFTHKYSSTKPY